MSGETLSKRIRTTVTDRNNGVRFLAGWIAFLVVILHLHLAVQGQTSPVVDAFGIAGPAPDQSEVHLVNSLILYTPLAREQAGGEFRIIEQIRAATMEANMVFQNTRVPVRFRNAHISEVEYSESGSLRQDLSRMTLTGDGHLDTIFDMRDAYEADLICLVVGPGDYYFYGLQGPSQRHPFSTIRQDRLVGNFELPVAWGFNFGCQTDREHADSLGALPYSYGHHVTDDVSFATAESFTGPRRLPVFSNPRLSYFGSPLGIPDGFPGASDNASVIDQTAAIVAQFRGPLLSTRPPRIVLTMETTDKAGDNNRFFVEAEDADGIVAAVEFFANDTSVGIVSNAPYELPFRASLSGEIRFQAQAFDNLGAVSVSGIITNAFRPTNDDFSDRSVLTGNNATTFGTTLNATRETNELSSARASVWYEWTSPADGLALISMQNGQHSTIIGLGYGEELNTINWLTNNLADRGKQFRIPVTQGTNIVITVDDEQRFPIFTLNVDLYPPITNDHFEDRITLVAGDRARSHNFIASSQEGEPSHKPSNVHGHTPLGRSIWWKWIAPTDGLLNIVPTTSSAGGLLNFYSGSELTNLTRIGWSTLQSGGTVRVNSGVEYQIAVDAYHYFALYDGIVEFDLTFNPSPRHDHREDALVLAGGDFTGFSDNVAATSDGDPLWMGYNSVWWRWIAPRDGTMRITATSSSFQPRLNVYEGDLSLSTNLVASGSGVSGIVFSAMKDREYFIAASANSQTFGQIELQGGLSGLRLITPVSPFLQYGTNEIGVSVQLDPKDGILGDVVFRQAGELLGVASEPDYDLVLTNLPQGVHEITLEATNTAGNYRFGPPLTIDVRPGNDLFENRRVLTGVEDSDAASNVNGHREIDEPSHGHATGNSSIWWTWQAPESGDVDIEVAGYGTAIYLGERLDTLIPVLTSWSPKNRFFAEQGNFYHVAAAGHTGPIGIHIKQIPRPANDHFSDRVFLEGSSLAVPFTLISATAEPGEPIHGPETGRHSVWYEWTSPTEGQVTFSAPGFHANQQTYETAISLYRGNRLDNLSEITNYNAGHPFPIETKAGERFQIALAAYGDRTAAFTLNVSHVARTSNDRFTNAISIVGGFAELSANNLLATTDAGEPTAILSRGRSIWWHWIAPRTAETAIRIAADNFLTRAIFQGSTLDSLVQVQVDPISGTFPAIAGTTYTIALDHPFDITAYPWSIAQQIIELGSPTNGTILRGDDQLLPLRFAPSPVLTEADRVEYLLNGTPFATNLTPPFEFTLTNPPRGHHLLTTRLWAGNYPLGESKPARFTVSPENDNFSDRTTLTGTNISATANPSGATVTGNSVSLWWKWIAPIAGTADFAITGPNWWGATVSEVNGGTNLVELTRVHRPNTPTGIFSVSAGKEYAIGLSPAVHHTSEVGFSIAVTPSPSPLAPPPINDNFTNRIQVSGSEIHIVGTNTLATTEPNEPQNYYYPSPRTLWWSWIPTSTGYSSVVVKTDFAAVVTCLQGDSLTNLTRLGYRRDSGHFTFEITNTQPIAIQVGTSPYSSQQHGRVAISATVSDFRLVRDSDDTGFVAGHLPLRLRLESNEPDTFNDPFHLFVDSTPVASSTPPETSATFTPSAWTGPHNLTAAITNAAGFVRFSPPLELTIRPANDDFANPNILTGREITANGTTRYASRETDEPPHLPIGSNATASVWFVWTAPESGMVSLTPFPTSVDTVTIPAPIVANQAYYSQYPELVGPTRPGLRPRDATALLLAPPLSPLSTRSAALRDVSIAYRGSVSSIGAIVGGSSGSTGSNGGNAGTVAPVSQRNRSGISVYQGDTVTNLNLLTHATGGAALFRVIGGQKYAFAIEYGDGSATGFRFSLQLTPHPPNDDFVNREVLNGHSIVTRGTNSGATLEPGEVQLGGGRSAASIWWSWTPRASGETTLKILEGDNPDYGHATAFGLYTGEDREGLQLIATNNWQQSGELKFYANAGTTYQITADGKQGRRGQFTLSLTGPHLPPRLDHQELRHQNREFRIRLDGLVGQTFRVQTSTNLTDWSELMIETIVEDDTEIVDTTVGDRPRRYYRAVPFR